MRGEGRGPAGVSRFLSGFAGVSRFLSGFAGVRANFAWSEARADGEAAAWRGAARSVEQQGGAAAIRLGGVAHAVDVL